MATVNLLVGTQKGAFIFESGVERKEWTPRGPILPGWEVRDLSYDARTGKLWAAVASYVYGPTVQVSEDMGKTWRQIEKGPKYEEGSPGTLSAIWTIVPGPASQPGVLYAGVADAGIFVSRDDGETWEELKGLSQHPTRGEWMPGAGGMCCHSILIDPSNPQRLWVGVSAVGVFRSEDGGLTWQQKNNGLPIVVEGKEHKDVGTCVHRLVKNPLNTDRLYQQNHQGVFRSDNAGDSWQRIENGLEGIFGFPMAMHPSQPDTVYIVPEQSDEFRFPKDGKLTVYRSEDGGQSWHPLRDGLPEGTYSGIMRQCLATDGLDPCGVYFGTTGGAVHFSHDDGDTWGAIPQTLPRIQSVSAVVRNGA